MELVTSQVYSPKLASFDRLIVIVGVEPTVSRPFFHSNEGKGLPVALHFNSFESPI